MQETPSRRDPVPPAAEMLPQSWRAALTAEQQEWISRMLFIRDHLGRPRLTTDLNLWWFPPQPQPVYHQPPASPEPFFACRLFLWMPHRIWRLQLTCPQPSCTGSMTKAGLYRTIRRVLDIDGWCLMATEYLECRQCKKKVAGWSQGIIRQLPPTYSCQFPAVLTYKLSCDQRVVGQLRSRTLGNSATRLYNTLREQHSDAWMRRAIHYLGVCEQFQALCSSARFAPPPPMPAVPSPAWLLTVYGYEVALRLEEYKARITSTLGSILKMDSTKKVTKKLAGAAANTAASVTSVGNEHGQVLMSILTCSEGSEGLSAMAVEVERFIPGTSASARYFQAFLVDGVVRWNEDRAAAAAPARAAEVNASLHSYSGHLKHALNQKSKRVLGHELVEDFTKPAAYTGELIGVEYLFQQTGSVLEEISDNPDPPDETAAISIIEREDEGIQVDEEDPTIFPPKSPSSSSTAAFQSGAPGSEPHPSSPGSQAPSPPPQESHSDSTTKGRPLLPSKELPLVPVGQRQPFDSELPEEQPGPSSGSLPPAPPPPPGSSAPLPLAPSWPVSGPALPNLAPTPSATPPPPPPPRLPRSTLYRRRKLAEAGEGPQRKNKGYLCSKCGQPKRLDTGHTRVAGVSYCATFGGKSVEEWKKELQK
ncbi:PREDICTED: uncharacterized protein LOC107099224 [Cyprinodon variegatus]|uniref:uncharacterized protein LOC107099224 n=1 Tax=Cyprinodon variegatus TaxID=28743 RepID=UPI00074268D3|nr:PREDICTED: uncharacterized protein LOC107099224 [Cyprinodon variegatus]